MARQSYRSGSELRYQGQTYTVVTVNTVRSFRDQGRDWLANQMVRRGQSAMIAAWGEGAKRLTTFRQMRDGTLVREMEV